MIFRKALLILGFAVVLLGFGVARAEDLPTMMVGKTVMTQGSGTSAKTYYGGLNGNYVVLNTDPNSTYGFQKAKLVGDACKSMVTGNSATSNPVCFLLVVGNNGSVSQSRIMTGQTRVNGDVFYELPALYFGGVNISGDAYGNDYLSNFQFWGRNLAQGSGNLSGTGATWQMGSTIDPRAQSYWGDAQLANANVINILRGEAKAIDSANSPTLDISISTQYNLLSSTISDNSNADANKYPDGKIWVVQKPDAIKKNLKISLDKTLTLNGKGTIIVTGDLILQSGAKINSTGLAGIIVLGNVSFGGNNSVNVPIFAIGDLQTTNKSDTNFSSTGKFSVNGNNVSLVGSFVARSFPGLNDRSNVQILYDPRLDSDWPPGFRYLNLPSASEVGNKQ